MGKEQSSYTITNQTLAIIPVNKRDYHSIVFEQERVIHTKEKPFQLIQAACLEHWSTYEGRRRAVVHQTGFQQKVPIPISINKKIFAFPTYSPHDHACCWIFSSHVRDIAAISIENRMLSEITFHTGKRLSIDVSPYILKKQFQRTLQCMYMISGGKLTHI